MSKMLWVFSRYKNPSPEESEHYIKSSMCHPLYYKVRDAYIFEMYGRRVVQHERVECFDLDFGGMVCTTDPSIDLKVGKHRTFSCWTHHASYVIEELERAKVIKHGRLTFYKFARWPNTICFISSKDRDTILAGVDPFVNEDEEGAHKAQMRENLVQANVAAGTPEDEVRQMLKGPHPDN